MEIRSLGFITDTRPDPDFQSFLSRLHYTLPLTMLFTPVSKVKEADSTILYWNLSSQIIRAKYIVNPNPVIPDSRINTETFTGYTAFVSTAPRYVFGAMYTRKVLARDKKANAVLTYLKSKEDGLFTVDKREAKGESVVSISERTRTALGRKAPGLVRVFLDEEFNLLSMSTDFLREETSDSLFRAILAVISHKVEVANKQNTKEAKTE